MDELQWWVVMMQFVAVVDGVRTLSDNGIRVSIDLLESAIAEAAQLMEYKRLGVALRVTVEPLGSDDDSQSD